MTLSATEWLTVALVIITALYAWATFRILRANEAVVAAMKEQTEAQLRPYVVVAASPRVGTTLLCLTIENAGRSSAQNLRLEIDRDFYVHAKKEEPGNVAKLPAFVEPIRSLAPGTQLVFILGIGHTISAAADELCPRVFNVQASYESGTRSYSEMHTVDLRPLMHSSVVHDPVAEEIEKLRKSLERLLDVRRAP
jgi:hypothetical protein